MGDYVPKSFSIKRARMAYARELAEKGKALIQEALGIMDGRINPSVDMCQCPGCYEAFVVKSAGAGRKYCSLRCANRAKYLRKKKLDSKRSIFLAFIKGLE